jgi:hypothetical protein
MLFVLTVAALAHPNHGDGPLHTPSESDIQRRFPAVPSAYVPLVAALKARTATADAAADAWKVSDLLLECDVIVRFAGALPVKALHRSEPDRLVVTERSTAIINRTTLVRKALLKDDREAVHEHLHAIEADLDALPK